MSAIYSRERNRFENEHKKFKEECLNAGMSEEEIQAIYEKDLKAFHRDMAYMNHVVPLDNIEEFDPDSLSPRQKKIVMEMTCEDPEFETTFSWLDEITLQPLASSIHKLSVDDKYLLTLLFKYEYTHQEICKHFGIDKSALSRRFDALMEALKSNSPLPARHSSWFSGKGAA